MTTDSIYFEGRTRLPLNGIQRSNAIQDIAFIDERIDGMSIFGNLFERCTFANISFKEVSLNEIKFINCVFIGCYFRKCNIVDTSFTGCKIIDCNFTRASIQMCNFFYTTFTDCFISFSQLQHCLPGEPNLREELARNLSVEAAKLGYLADSNLFHKVELNAREEHLFAAVKGETQWYRTHYDCFQRIIAAFDLLISRFNGCIFGYGQNIWILMRTLILSIIFFWGLFYYFRNQLAVADNYNKSPDILHTLLYSIHNILPTSFETNVSAISTLTKIFAGVETLWGVILAALFASYIFRWSLNR